MSAKTIRASVDDFIKKRTLAVVGASRNSKKFGSLAYRELKTKGYRVFPINRSVTSIDGDRTYSRLQELPEQVDGVVIIVPPIETERVVQDACEAGINSVWMQQGSESLNAIEYCRNHGISEIHGECILMFAKPVKSYHKCHQVLMRLLGRLPT